MRRTLVFVAIAVAVAFSAIGLVAASGSTTHASRVGYPNFICISTPHFGICVGPPTKKG